ncbi:MAG: hypothetical protein ABI120_02960 [Gemmatimonadaceae bacterium]
MSGLAVRGASAQTTVPRDALGAAVPHSVVPHSVVPHSVMQRLAVQLNKDSPAMRDCDVKTAFNFSARAFDLNGDKQPEYLLTSVGACECGQVNCSQWVYRVNDTSFQLLLEGEGYVLAPAATSHGGYRDLTTTSRGNAVIVDHVWYAYDGRRYQRSGSTIENLETHARKPTEQRIQFTRGASSARVIGSASPGFPDRWTFVAKRGQTVSIALEKIARAAATFRVIGPGANGEHVLVDLQHTWISQLPVDGSYTILVESKTDGPVRYVLTVGIR